MNILESQKIKQIKYYKIADHLICIVDRIGIELDRALPSFVPFKIDEPNYGFNITSIEINNDLYDLSSLKLRLLSDVSVIWAENFRLEVNYDSYFTSILPNNNGRTWIMKSSKDFAFSKIFVDEDELYTTTKLSWLIMISFGQACLNHKTLLMHASVIIKDELGYAFLGKSGTGKSTHSNLWLKYIKDTELLNDDNPAIRVFSDGDVFIYGTPWSGKTWCYKNRKVKLGGITRLKQSPKNFFKWQNGSEALITVLPSGSSLRWDEFLFPQMVGILETIIELIPIAHLDCLADREAVELNYFNFTNRM